MWLRWYICVFVHFVIQLLCMLLFYITITTTTNQIKFLFFCVRFCSNLYTTILSISACRTYIYCRINDEKKSIHWSSFLFCMPISIFSCIYSFKWFSINYIHFKTKSNVNQNRSMFRQRSKWTHVLINSLYFNVKIRLVHRAYSFYSGHLVSVKKHTNKMVFWFRTVDRFITTYDNYCSLCGTIFLSLIFNFFLHLTLHFPNVCDSFAVFL